MHLIRSFSFGSAISTVLDKFSLIAQNQARQEQENKANRLRFHPIHGKAITLNEDSTNARRDETYFEHSVVFSNRSINVGETIAVEVNEISREFHGPLRIGFTSCNPSVFENDVVPLGRDLKNSVGFWIKSVMLFPLRVGSVIYFKVDLDGTVLYGVNGINGGIFLKDVDISQHLWVILEAYGSVQSFGFVDKSMVLDKDNVDLIDVNENIPMYPCANTTGQGETRLPLRGLTPNILNTPLSVRRNVRLASIENVIPAQLNESLSPVGSPHTPFKSPLEFNLGLCIVCTDREKNTAFAECGHLCMCYDCANTFKNQRSPTARTRRSKNLCPICRRPIISILRVYT